MSGRRRTPRTTLKIAALAPIPSARVRTTVMASPLTLVNDRNANWRSVMMLMPSLRGSPGGYPAACPSCWFPPSLSCSALGLRHGLEVPFERLEAFCPPFRNQFQITARHLELLGLQRPTAFPALPHASDQARVGAHEQVLGDGLPRDLRSGREAGDGLRPARAKAGPGAPPRPPP